MFDGSNYNTACYWLNALNDFRNSSVSLLIIWRNVRNYFVCSLTIFINFQNLLITPFNFPNCLISLIYFAQDYFFSLDFFMYSFISLFPFLFNFFLFSYITLDHFPEFALLSQLNSCISLGLFIQILQLVYPSFAHFAVSRILLCLLSIFLEFLYLF